MMYERHTDQHTMHATLDTGGTVATPTKGITQTIQSDLGEVNVMHHARL
jgi:hypothetical protein